jgi:hypothetical protein
VIKRATPFQFDPDPQDRLYPIPRGPHVAFVLVGESDGEGDAGGAGIGAGGGNFSEIMCRSMGSTRRSNAMREPAVRTA